MHKARKRFGQHFLVDHTLIAQLLQHVNLHATDACVEIGPGLGALTTPLLQQLDRLLVIELDRDLVTRLEARQHPALTVVQGDALKVDLNTMFDQHAPVETRWRIIGNLPYNVGTPLLLQWLELHHRVRDIHVMLQAEVVNRMAAAPGSRAYGRLSVMLQSTYHIQPLMVVPPSAFDPPPKVDSAIVRLVPRKDPVDCKTRHALATATRLAFANKRKTLRNNLKGYLESDMIFALDIDPGCRAEVLDQDQFIALAKSLVQQNS